MTSRQYHRIEGLIAGAENITNEHPLLTPQGHEIKAAIKDLLNKVVAERVRAELREAIPGTQTPTDPE